MKKFEHAIDVLQGDIYRLSGLRQYFEENIIEENSKNRVLSDIDNKINELKKAQKLLS